MKAGIECVKSESGFHCWHRQAWTSDPHKDDEKCCHCGKAKDLIKHGPYAPHKWPHGPSYDDASWRRS